MKGIKYKNKRKLNPIALLIIIVLIILICLLVLLKNLETYKEKENLKYINSTEWNNEIFPDGMPKMFRQYSGELTAPNIGKSMYYFANSLLPKYKTKFNNYSDEQINKYYKRNKNLIYLQFGKITEKEFLYVMQEIQNTKVSELEFEEYYIDKEKIRKNGDTVSAFLYIKYKNADEISFNIDVKSNSQNDCSSVKYYK